MLKWFNFIFKNFIKNGYKEKLATVWDPPTGTHSFDLDYDTGEIANDKTSKVVKEIFRESEDPINLNINRIVDGGYGMGQDLLFFDNSFDKDLSDRSFLRKSFGAITTGDQY